MSENKIMAAMEMRGVSVGAMRDSGFRVLEDMNWSVAPGEFWVLAGQQHSGKSDLLLMSAGLMPPVGGSYKFFGNETQMLDDTRLAERLQLGFVFETGQLFNHLTIAENVALPLQYHRDLPGEEALQRTQPLLEMMELTPLADVTSANIGENWLKRAALARALALKPDVLLLDNPLGGLDARHARWWLRFLDELWRGHEWPDKKPMTIVATTDDLRPWRSEARRFALLNEKRFHMLGSWNDVVAADDVAVKELLAAPLDGFAGAVENEKNETRT
jgi:ABC-type transporter Mla maintaining outer membrane lipid asymmetry ATPase subunit MlaF